MTITEILYIMNNQGVFAYVIPFLLIFAVVFAVLKKTEVLGDEKPIITIVSAAIGLLALQFGFVSTFFADIFPRFGVGMAVMLVLLILLGLMGIEFKSADGKTNKAFVWIGWIIAVSVIIWALNNWNLWWDTGFSSGQIWWWVEEYFWAIVMVGLVVGAIVAVNKDGNRKNQGGE